MHWICHKYAENMILYALNMHVYANCKKYARNMQIYRLYQSNMKYAVKICRIVQICRKVNAPQGNLRYWEALNLTWLKIASNGQKEELSLSSVMFWSRYNACQWLYNLLKRLYYTFVKNLLRTASPGHLPMSDHKHLESWPHWVYTRYIQGMGWREGYSWYIFWPVRANLG